MHGSLFVGPGTYLSVVIGKVELDTASRIIIPAYTSDKSYVGFSADMYICALQNNQKATRRKDTAKLKPKSDDM